VPKILRFIDMAIEVRSAPVLTGAAARRFDQNAARAFKRKHTIDWSEQMKIAKDILANAKFNPQDVE